MGVEKAKRELSSVYFELLLFFYFLKKINQRYFCLPKFWEHVETDVAFPFH